MKSEAQTLLAEAQEFFDRRIDPLDHADFAERLAHCPEALEEVIALRSFVLSIAAPIKPAGPAQATPPVNLKSTPWSRQWWLAPLAAAAALVLMLHPGEADLPPDLADPELVVQAPPRAAPSATPVAAPAVLRFSQSSESTTLSPPTTGNVLSLSITSSRIIRP